MQSSFAFTEGKSVKNLVLRCLPKYLMEKHRNITQDNHPNIIYALHKGTYQCKLLDELQSWVEFVQASEKDQFFGNCLLTGKPGSGKTAVVTRLARKMSKSACVFTSYIDCGIWKGKQADSIEKILKVELARLEERRPSFLILDGLDFIHIQNEEEQRQVAIERIFIMLWRLLSASRVPVLVTARSLHSLHKTLVSQGGKRFFSKTVEIPILKQDVGTLDNPTLKAALLRNIRSTASLFPILFDSFGLSHMFMIDERPVSVTFQPSSNDWKSLRNSKDTTCFVLTADCHLNILEDKEKHSESEKSKEIEEIPVENFGVSKTPPYLQLQYQCKLLDELQSWVEFVQASEKDQFFGNCLLTGKPGSGKTAVVTRLARKMSKSACVFTSYIDCGIWKGKQADSIEKILKVELARLEERRPSFLILDGLDFIHIQNEEEQRQVAIERIFIMLWRLLSASRVPVLVTARSLHSLHKTLVSQGGKRFFSKTVEIPILKQMTRGVSTNFGEPLSDESKKLIKEVRLKLNQPIHPIFDTDFNLYRFVLAAERLHKKDKDIIETAAKAVNNHLRLRKALNLDTDKVKTFDENPIFQKRLMPRGDIQSVCNGHNRLLWYIEYATITVESIAHSIRSSEACRFQFWQFEYMLRQVMAHEEVTGRFSSLRHVVDMTGYEINPFTMLFVSSGTLAYYSELFHYQNYPELVTPVDIVHIAKWIHVPYKIAKAMMPSGFADKFRLHDGGYIKALKEDIDIKDIPKTEDVGTLDNPTLKAALLRNIRSTASLFPILFDSFGLSHMFMIDERPVSVTFQPSSNDWKS